MNAADRKAAAHAIGILADLATIARSTRRVHRGGATPLDPLLGAILGLSIVNHLNYITRDYMRAQDADTLDAVEWFHGAVEDVIAPLPPERKAEVLDDVAKRYRPEPVTIHHNAPSADYINYVAHNPLPPALATETIASEFRRRNIVP